MFYHVRYQTGELKEVISEMKQGNIPCLEVDGYDELNWFLAQLASHDVYRIEDIPFDKTARDAIKEPEFEFRIAFSSKSASAAEVNSSELMYMDVYFEPDFEETYDSVGEL